MDRGPNYGQFRHCTIHAGARLIPSIDFPDQLLCTQCGTLYPSDLTMADTQITAKFTPRRLNETKVNIVTGNKRQKKRFDDFGNEINLKDSDIMRDIAEGRKIRYYNENKPIVKRKYSF
jgi:hypothetical protein